MTMVFTPTFTTTPFFAAPLVVTTLPPFAVLAPAGFYIDWLRRVIHRRRNITRFVLHNGWVIRLRRVDVNANADIHASCCAAASTSGDGAER
ncbi:MAG: hypothetical protein NVSMB28_12090 [Collimonas sp.]